MIIQEIIKNGETVSGNYIFNLQTIIEIELKRYSVDYMVFFSKEGKIYLFYNLYTLSNFYEYFIKSNALVLQLFDKISIHTKSVKNLDEYTNNEPYEQEFSKKPQGKELISKFSGMIPYHINIGALMFLSFIVELEIFKLFNSIIPCNTILNPNRNNLNTAFCHKVDLCTPTRIYKDNILTNIAPLFYTFTYELDLIFINFTDLCSFFL